jgi:hypothetical protein
MTAKGSIVVIVIVIGLFVLPYPLANSSDHLKCNCWDLNFDNKNTFSPNEVILINGPMITKSQTLISSYVTPIKLAT